MPDYRRSRIEGAPYFFTEITLSTDPMGYGLTLEKVINNLFKGCFPIEHGYMERAADWPYSSFDMYVKEGIYDTDWVGGNEGRLQRLVRG